MRLIDAEELERLFNAQIEQGATDAFDAFDDALQDALTIDAVPVVHAMWIPSESDFDDDDTLFDVEEWCDWQCCACREDICYDDPMPIRLLPKYCPNCGARMDGGDRDAAD